MTERCTCGTRATSSCNDCERPLCDECASPDFRCTGCFDGNASLFDDPERVSLDDDEDTDVDNQSDTYEDSWSEPRSNDSSFDGEF